MGAPSCHHQSQPWRKIRSRHKIISKKKNKPSRSVFQIFEFQKKRQKSRFSTQTWLSSVQLWQYLALEDLWQLYNPFRVNLPAVVTPTLLHTFQAWLVGWLVGWLVEEGLSVVRAGCQIATAPHRYGPPVLQKVLSALVEDRPSGAPENWQKKHRGYPPWN